MIFDEGVTPGVIHTFVNGRRCVGGGTHVQGLASGIASVLRNFELPSFCDHNHPFAGKTIVLAVNLREPQWAGATKTVLTGTRPERLVHEMVVKHLPAQIERQK